MVGPQHLRPCAPATSRLPARFRTIQACPKDLRVLPPHPEPAVSWHSGFRGGAMLDRRRRQFMMLLVRIGVLMGVADDREGQVAF
jgi:hypothetical protein